MDRTLHKLSRLADSIPARFTELDAGLRTAMALAEIDPETATIKIRKVLEWMAEQLFERHIGKIRHDDPPPLDQMLKQLFGRGHIPKLVVSYANAVKELGNVGAHDHSHRAGVREFAMAVQNLIHVIEWYVTEAVDAEPGRAGAVAVQVAGGRLPRVPREVPRLLPHLCDRIEQEDQFAEQVSSHLHEDGSRPLVCVLHGDEDQCHDHYLERLRHVSLPRLLGLPPDQAVRQYHVVCPREWNDPRRFRDRLRARLALSVLLAESATPEEIARAIARQGVPVIVHAHLTTDEWRTSGPGPFQGFVRFWSDWPKLGAPQLLLVCLAVTYRLGEGLGWPWRLRYRMHNRRLRNFLRGLDLAAMPGVGGLVFDELLGVTQTDAENWARDDRTRNYCAGKLLVDDVRRLYRRPGARIAMTRLAAAFEALLDEAGPALGEA